MAVLAVSINVFFVLCQQHAAITSTNESLLMTLTQTWIVQIPDVLAQFDGPGPSSPIPQSLWLLVLVAVQITQPPANLL